MQLTPTQIDEFNTRGVLIACDALTHDDQQPLIDELCEWIDARAKALHAEGKLSELHEDAPFTTRYGLLFKQCSEIGQGMDIMHYRGRAIFEFLRNDNLLDLLESLLGPEITCNPIQHLRSKPPQAYENREGPSFHNVPWHQDAGVMMPEAESSEVVTCWFPLADAMVEHGCMEVLPGIVETGYLRHQSAGGTTIIPEVMPEAKPLALECKRGDVVLMSRFTPHRSTPNFSDQCRWSLDLRYQPTGQHTGRTGHPDFIARSHHDPANELSNYKEWYYRWVDAFESPNGVVMHRGE